MSGATIDYELRPAKNIDRRVFVELLARSERYATLQDATYVSMGGYPMTDHRIIHKRLGIESLISIDGDPEVVKRQEFNKPTEKCVCIHALSGEFIDDISDKLLGAGVDLAARKIVWLDYTRPNTLDEQLSEFETLLNKASPLDIIRITLNANNDALKYKTKQGMDSKQIREARFLALKGLVGSYLPNGSKDTDLKKDTFPILLAKILGRASEEAFPPSDLYTFLPLSTISYQDGQRMLTMTGIVIKKSRISAFLADTDFKRWPFFSESYDDVITFNVAVLTMKERMLMERLAVSTEEENIIEKMGFEKLGGLMINEYFNEFKSHARFYPTHAQIEL